MNVRLPLLALGTVAAIAALYFIWPYLASRVQEPLVGDWYLESDPGVQLSTTRGKENLRLAIGAGGVLFEYDSPASVTKALFALHEETDGVPGPTGKETNLMRTSVTSSGSTDRMASGLGSCLDTYVLTGSLERTGTQPVERRVAAAIGLGGRASTWTELAWLGDLQTTFRWQQVGNVLTISAEGPAVGSADAIVGLAIPSKAGLILGSEAPDGSWNVSVAASDLPRGHRLVRIAGTADSSGFTWTISFQGS